MIVNMYNILMNFKSNPTKQQNHALIEHLNDINKKLDAVLSLLQTPSDKNKFALVIGVDYVGTNKENTLCSHNARIMAEFLKQHKYVVTILTDGNCSTPVSRRQSLSATSRQREHTRSRSHSPQKSSAFAEEAKPYMPPTKNIIFQHIKNLLLDDSAESVFIYFSGIGYTLLEKGLHSSIFLPSDHDLYGIISIDMLNEVLYEYNRNGLKIFLVFDCCINTESQDPKLEYYGISNIMATNPNIIYMSSKLKKGSRDEDEVGTVTKLFTKKYIYKITIRQLEESMNAQLFTQAVEISSPFDTSCVLSL